MAMEQKVPTSESLTKYTLSPDFSPSRSRCIIARDPSGPDPGRLVSVTVDFIVLNVVVGISLEVGKAPVANCLLCVACSYVCCVVLNALIVL